MTNLPTMSSSMSDGLFLMRVQTSIVNMVELELNIEVSELIRAASITASISPVKPVTFNINSDSDVSITLIGTLSYENDLVALI